MFRRKLKILGNHGKNRYKLMGLGGNEKRKRGKKSATNSKAGMKREKDG